MRPEKLTHPPLVEAILEVRWQLQEQVPGVAVDPKYKLLVGRLYDRLSRDYPFHEPLPTASMPDEMLGYVVQHRFRAAEGVWPLVQVGPGLVTLNDPRDTRINQLNMGVVGDLGTGKTQFLKSLVYQMTRPVETQEVPAKAFVFDYKKDYVDDAFTAMVGAKVLDPSVTPIPLNFFAIPGGGNRFELGSRALLFADTIDKIYAIGPNQNQALRSAILDAYADLGTPMLGDVLDRYRAAMSGNDSVTSALSLMVDFGLFETDPAKLVGFEQLFGQSVVLALGNIAEAGTQVQNLLVTLFLNLLHVEYMKKRTKMPIVRGADGINRRVIDSYVLVDEAHNIMDYEFESLRKLLLEGREFGMGVILSSQYLSHFKTRKTNWAEPLLTWAIHKVPNVTSAELQRIGFRQNLEEICNRISSLDVHHSLFKSPVGRASTGIWLREKPFYQFARGD